MKNDLYFSILISLYNGTNPDFFNDSMNSIYFQSYQNFEIILIVDGKVSDKHHHCINTWKRKFNRKLHIYSLSQNTGLANALNCGIENCNYEWITRMDADDLMTEKRLEKQKEFIENNTDIDLFGSWIEEYDDFFIKSNGIRVLPCKHKDIIKFGKWRSPLNHVTVCYKKSVLKRLGGYNYKLKRSQDYALWANFIVNGYKLANIPEVLVKVRAGSDFFTNRNTIRVIKYDLRQRIYMYKIGFLNIYEFFFSLLFRLLIRISPLFIVKKIYKFLRQ